MKKYSKIIVFIIIIIAVIFIINFFDLTRFLSLSYVKNQLDVWAMQVQENILVTSGVFFLLYVIATAFSIPGAIILTMLAGALFGLWRGVLLVSFASTIGATLAFLISRFFLRQGIETKFDTQFKKINKGIEKDGAFYLFALRLVPIVPFFVINLVMGITKLPVFVFMFVSQIGMLPGTFVYVNGGRALANLNNIAGILSPQLWISFALLAILPFISRKFIKILKTNAIYKKFKHKKPKQFDTNIAVIGAGSGGLISSYIAATVKAKVMLFEKAEMGGDCLNRGCVPSKAILSISKIAKAHHEGAKSGIHYTKPIISFSKVMKSVHNAIHEIAPHDSIERYTNLGVECIKEEAKIISPWEIKTASRTIHTQSIIVATGGTPIIPDIPGIDKIKIFTSDTIWKIQNKPTALLVIGGGPIGCELAYSFSLLGTKVTMVQSAKHILHREDPDVAKIARQSLEDVGVRIITNSTVESFQKGKGNTFTATIAQKKNNSTSIIKDYFTVALIAIGRKAVVESIGLNELGIAYTDSGTIATNEYLQTNIPNIYAVGDVAGPYQFTHIAGHMAWYASVNALFGKIKKFPVDYSVVPSVTFLSPEIARVGLNETEAKEKNIPYEITKYEMKELDRAIAEKKTVGFIKVLTPPNKDTILGATVVAERGGEILGEFILAMKHKIGLNKILGTIHPYPTFIEAVKNTAGVWKKARAPKRVLNAIGRIFANSLGKHQTTKKQ